ncbi:hypothetical protein FPQ18DRAFT_129118 [Pyronema domesticum]|uniref:Similar to Ran GTPase-activating protein 1 acc. no. P41391 n=1 Tax=Pyronema omphalodes (strain CBS 100304) TaxID=1076935 RepID=U4LRS0_PYROM|nr:hypothetical protein FPQ18DRAFT_129118 [Pyronema domesticum]CCX34861.1 Similar to Ran GTPase-activating protein 1; acc. no. P41391 [Pyronema omphalodes CBS 100304]
MSNVFILKSGDGKPLKLDQAADIEPHIVTLKANADVEEIRLGGNTLGVEACKALAEVLLEKKNLKIFNAADIFTGRLISEIPDALSALLTALLTLPKLHTVDLSDNAFGGRLAEVLRDFYSKAGPLRHLLLNNNGLGPAGGAIVANSIKDLAVLKASDPSLPPLETIVCGRNRLENGSMEAWAAAYAAHKTLKTVKMVQNGIRPEGIQILLRDGLLYCQDLLHLDLQDNTFTELGSSALAIAVEGWTKLEVLGVADCLLSARGGLLLGEALQKGANPDLTKLSLQYNEIDIVGAKAIKNAVVAGLSKLEVLELNGNKFSEEDPLVEELRELFEERGFEGLDSLSDMEEDSEDEDEDYDESDKDDEDDEKKVPVKKDDTVDELTSAMEGAKIA